MIGDGFGGRSWYVAHNYQVGSYTAYTVCDTNQQLYAWGSSQLGELGNGSITSTDVPVAVTGMKHVRFYTTGYISVAIKNDNSAWIWGKGSGGSSSSGFGTTPSQILNDVKFADASTSHAVFVKNDGTVWGVGRNYDGQLGNNTSTPFEATPVQMSGITTAVRAVAWGELYGASLILLADSTVMITGYDYTGSGLSSYAPIHYGLDSIVDIKGGSGAAYALTATGEVYSFGDNSVGQLGLGPTVFTAPPTKITFPAGAAPIVALSSNCDGDCVLALDENGKVYAWGDNYWGQLGNGTSSEIYTPQLVVSNAKDIFAGETFCYIIKSDNTLWASGASGWSIPDYGSIWMNLTNVERDTFTQIDPTIAPMNLCAPTIAGCIPPDTPAVTVTHATCATPTGSITVTSPAGSGVTYSINGSTFTNTSGTFTGLAPGTYHVWVKSLQGCVSGSTMVAINAISSSITPVASVTTAPTCAAPTGTITISSPTGAGYTYSINGVNYTGTAVFAGLSAGTYSVTVKDSSGCKSAPIAVTVNPPAGAPTAPTVTITQPDCSTASGTITVSAPAGGGLTYSIDGTSYVSSGTFAGIAAGTYNVTVRDSMGCTSAATVATINSAPATTPAPTVNTVEPTCTTLTGAIIITPSAGVTYSVNGGAFDTTTVYAGLAPGTYNVTAQMSGGCASAATVVSINVAPGTPIAPTVSITPPGCNTSTGTITVTAPTGAGLAYSIDGINYSNISGVFTGVAPGTYNITVRSNAGCTSAPTVAVINTVPVAPPLPTLVVTQPTCLVPSGTIMVTSPIGAGLFYSIDGINYTNASGVFAGLAAGTYNITVSNGSCTSASAVATVNASPALLLQITASPNPVTAGQPVTLNVAGDHPYTVVAWLPASEFPNQTAWWQTITPHENYTYMAVGKTADGCVDTATIYVVVNPQREPEPDAGCPHLFWVPNTFTPNGDGRNDFFEVYGKCLEVVELTIMNQWGQLMYRVRDKYPKWDGVSNGRPQPTGVYVYVVRAVFEDKKETIQHGTVNLIR